MANHGRMVPWLYSTRLFIFSQALYWRLYRYSSSSSPWCFINHYCYLISYYTTKIIKKINVSNFRPLSKDFVSRRVKKASIRMAKLMCWSKFMACWPSLPIWTNSLIHLWDSLALCHSLMPSPSRSHGSLDMIGKSEFIAFWKAGSALTNRKNSFSLRIHVHFVLL